MSKDDLEVSQVYCSKESHGTSKHWLETELKITGLICSIAKILSKDSVQVVLWLIFTFLN